MPGLAEARVLLGLGGNLGDPEAAMGAALRRLDRDPQTRVIAASTLYRTPPWGKLDQPDFLNCAVALTTERAPRAMLDLCLGVEKELKRERRERWGPRLIDIDILVFGDLTLHEPGLEVPHPRMQDRAFVLMPLIEIAPDLIVAGTPIADRLASLDTNGIVRLKRPRDWWRQPVKPPADR